MEKFYRTSPSVKKSPRAKKPRPAVSESDDDDDDDDDDYTGTDEDYSKCTVQMTASSWTV